ncbi:MAG TPA: hybrid sensor histidine kinase/response regulator, partial [Lachnospiraceae bacterium]|nr:hybrid sensor histidine kinase/response regulator [Lachnospiraceae bacterium]
MKDKREVLQKSGYIIILLVAIIILFQWYTSQNSSRMVERNKNYALDSARLKAAQIDEELNNTLNLINTYTYFIGESLSEPEITAQMLAEMEKNSLFDAVMFTDMEGVDYASDGRVADVTDREFYYEGIKGNSSISIIFTPRFFNEKMACFYAPVRYKGEIIGVLRGAYLAEEHLQHMLDTTYFGEKADVFFCTPDGSVIASSDGKRYEGNLADWLVQSGVIDEDTALSVKEVFEHGGEGNFICSSDSKTDNICVMYLPENEYVLVQTFPKNVTQNMIKAENRVGIQLEAMLIGMFVLYIFTLLFRARREKKVLKQENKEKGYIINGINSLFIRYALVDFEAGTYRYLEGTKPENSGLEVDGRYEDLASHLCAILANEKDRPGFAAQICADAVVAALEEHNDIRFECYVQRENKREWEHINVICLERKDGRASKALYTRQNITDLKEKELRIQAEMSVANRKERQYRIAITSSAICTYEFNLTKDLLEEDIVRRIEGKKISLLERTGLKAPCKVSDWMEQNKDYVLKESMEEYSAVVNVENLRKRFEQGDSEVTAEYWEKNSEGKDLCVRQSFIMTRDDDSGDIMVLVVTKDITGSVKKQREQTQALQDALMQA